LGIDLGLLKTREHVERIEQRGVAAKHDALRAQGSDGALDPPALDVADRKIQVQVGRPPRFLDRLPPGIASGVRDDDR
jgi:hypothetical protein